MRRNQIWLVSFAFVQRNSWWMPSYPQGMIWLLPLDHTCQARQWGIRLPSLTLWLHQLSKEYSIIVWLGPPIARKSWNSIYSLFCMFISCFLHPLIAFSSLFSKNCFLFIIIRHELCYPPIYNPLMKLSNVLFKKSLHLSLYLLSYEYACANFLMFPCICSIL